MKLKSNYVYATDRQRQYEKDLMNQDMIFKFNEIEIPVLTAKRAQDEIKQKAELKKLKKKQKKALEMGDNEETGSLKELIISDVTKEKEVIDPKSTRRRNTIFQPPVSIRSIRKHLVFNTVITLFEPE